MFLGDVEGVGRLSPPRSQATSRRPALLGLIVVVLPNDSISLFQTEKFQNPMTDSDYTKS